MIIDSTFWVAVSFLIFVGVVFYFKVPQKVNESLEENIKKIKEEVDNAEKLKNESKIILGEYETKLSKSKDEINKMIKAVSYTHLRAHETDSYLVCRLLLEKKKNSMQSSA